jgi:hypothetical protein
MLHRASRYRGRNRGALPRLRGRGKQGISLRMPSIGQGYVSGRFNIQTYTLVFQATRF